MQVSELKWEPTDTELSGCSVVQILPMENSWGFAAPDTYSVRIEVRKAQIFTTVGSPPEWDLGQTVVAVSLDVP